MGRKRFTKSYFLVAPESAWVGIPKFGELRRELRTGKSAPSVGLVAELNGRVIGAAWASAGEYMIGKGAVLTTEHFIAVDVDFCGRLLSAKTFLRMIAAIRKWSTTRNASRLLIHVSTGHDLASRRYPFGRPLKAAGRKMIGGGYVG